MKSITPVTVIGILQDGPGDNAENYKVVAVGRANNRRDQIVKIYDSCEKIWNMVGFLPDDMQVWTTLAGMVFSNDDGFFYCEGNSRDGRGIIGFSIRDGTSIFVPLPEYNVRFFFSKLFTCGSRVLILAGILRLNEDGINDGFSDVIMWEFQNGGNSSSSRWNEIVRMPSSLVEDVYRIIGVNGIFYSVGMGDYVCIKSHYRSNRDVLVYNFILNSWSWLSTTCPLQHMRPHVEYSTTIFEPRPDMKVG